MRRAVMMMVVGLVMLTGFGCAQNYYNVPRESYEKKVRVLGVAPIMVDGDSDIRHPEKAAVIGLLKEANRKNEKELVALLKDTGSYFSVRLLDEDADLLWSGLGPRRERRDDGGVVYNKYFFRPDALQGLIDRHKVDAVMVVVLSGLTRQDKFYSSNLLSYVSGDYNFLTASAQVLDRDGSVLWEYPNFRQRILTYAPFLALQYPDFDESKANAADDVEVKFRTVPGIGRVLAKSAESTLQPKGSVSLVYRDLFDAMLALMGSGRSDSGKEKGAAAPAPPLSAPQPAPALVAPPAPVPAKAPAPAETAAPAPAVAEQPVVIAPPGTIRELPVK